MCLGCLGLASWKKAGHFQPHPKSGSHLCYNRSASYYTTDYLGCLNMANKKQSFILCKTGLCRVEYGMLLLSHTPTRADWIGFKRRLVVPGCNLALNIVSIR
jgi:hypothetical protein